MQCSDLRGVKILLVEDDYYQACDSRNMLYEHGAEIVHATAHLHAVALILSEHKIDAAILDINLGSETTIDLARDFKRRAVPFLFHTGYNRVMLPDDLLDSPIVIKPSSPEELLSGLGGLISRSLRLAGT